MVTSGTYHKEHLFTGPDRLDLLQSSLFRLAAHYQWHLEAWAVFPNHYHFVAQSPANTESLRRFIRHLHGDTAREVNRLDNSTGRQVWHDYWDTHLTFERSYFARLNYVHQNPVHHGVMPVANQYRWCSASWFERETPPARVKTIYSFKTDQLKVPDAY
jgi:putative transposase